MDLEKVWVLPGVRPGEIQVSHPSKCLFKTSSPLSHPLNAITTQLMPLNLRGCVYSQGRSWEFGTGRLPSQRHLVYLRLFKRGRFEETQSKWPFHWASPKWNASQPKAEWLQSDFRGEGFLLVHACTHTVHTSSTLQRSARGSVVGSSPTWTQIQFFVVHLFSSGSESSNDSLLSSQKGRDPLLPPNPWFLYFHKHSYFMAVSQWSSHLGLNTSALLTR